MILLFNIYSKVNLADVDAGPFKSALKPVLLPLAQSSSPSNFFHPDKEVCSRTEVIRGGLVWPECNLAAAAASHTHPQTKQCMCEKQVNQ